MRQVDLLENRIALTEERQRSSGKTMSSSQIWVRVGKRFLRVSVSMTIDGSGCDDY